MTKIIAIINQKGGVGKTTTTVNLGAALAEKGKKVLLFDMDAQSNMTTHLGVGVQEGDFQEGIEDVEYPSSYDILKGSKTVAECVVHRSKNLDVVPSSLSLSAADLELGGVVGRELILKRALTNIQDNYDYIIIDCPPALGLLSLNALDAADSVIIPVQSEYLALHGVRQLLDTIEQVKSVFNPVLRVMGVLICLHDIRKKLARAVSDTIRTYFGDLVFETVIKTNVALAEAPSDGKTIFEYAPRERGADDYRELANEIESGKF